MKINISVILVIASVIMLNNQNLMTQNQNGLFRMENPYFAYTSLIDTMIKDPVIIRDKLLDIRETQQFKNLKNVADSNFKKPYLILINRRSSGGSFTKITNHLDTIYYIEYCFVEVDTIDLLDKHPRVQYLYYDDKDSICIFNDTETALSMRIMRNEKLNIKIDLKKPSFMFDAAIIKINENSEDIIENLLSFWRFEAKCNYLNVDGIFYHDDAFFIYAWFRYLERYGIFTKDFGFTDFDFR